VDDDYSGSVGNAPPAAGLLGRPETSGALTSYGGRGRAAGW